jgi:methylamine---glutamate N-methyltransferase subunit B
MATTETSRPRSGPAPALAFDLAVTSVRELNGALHRGDPGPVLITNPEGRHSLAVGLDGPWDVEIDGHAGYYCAGMNQRARVRVRGNAGVGLAENMMSGEVVVDGDASGAAGATARGGLLVVRGSAAARAGIALKGASVVVGGSVGHMSAFMAQRGTLLVCGDAGEALGDSLYEARIYVRGSVASLGADCIEKEMAEEHLSEVASLLAAADLGESTPAPDEFRRYGSARRLYNFHIDNAGAY